MEIKQYKDWKFTEQEKPDFYFDSYQSVALPPDSYRDELSHQNFAFLNFLLLPLQEVTCVSFR